VVYLFISDACEQGHHQSCDGGKPSPPGTFGGSKCTCHCHTPKAKDVKHCKECGRVKLF